MSSENLTLFFSATECNGWPRIKIFLNSSLVDDVEVVKNSTISIPLTLLPGRHTLSLVRYDKTNNNIVLNEHHKILKDQTVTLEEIWINDVKLPNFFLYSGTYFSNNQSYPSVLTWGANGEFIWEFATPIFSWAVIKKNSQEKILVDLFLPTPERNVVIEETIKSLEETIKDYYQCLNEDT